MLCNAPRTVNRLGQVILQLGPPCRLCQTLSEIYLPDRYDDEGAPLSRDSVRGRLLFKAGDTHEFGSALVGRNAFGVLDERILGRPHHRGEFAARQNDFGACVFTFSRGRGAPLRSWCPWRTRFVLLAEVLPLETGAPIVLALERKRATRRLEDG